jgi:hypothetical protein
LRLRVYIYLEPVSPAPFLPLLSLSLFSATLECTVILVSHRPEYLAAGAAAPYSRLASSSSSVEYLEIISATPLAAMDPEASSHQDTVASQDTRSRSTGTSADTGSATPDSSGGSWDPHNLSEDILSSLEQEGLIAARAISKLRVEPNAAMPEPLEEEIVMLKSHIDQGLSLPPSYFIKSMLRHYRLQLHHIALNSLTIIAGFVTLCEGFLGVYPHEDLFRMYFNICHNRDSNGDLRNCGSISFIPRSGKLYPYIKPHDSAKGWRGSSFY